MLAVRCHVICWHSVDQVWVKITQLDQHQHVHSTVTVQWRRLDYLWWFLSVLLLLEICVTSLPANSSKFYTQPPLILKFSVCSMIIWSVFKFGWFQCCTKYFFQEGRGWVHNNDGIHDEMLYFLNKKEIVPRKLITSLRSIMCFSSNCKAKSAIVVMHGNYAESMHCE